ncbi:MAG TPA: shikimate dehydrogenase [Gemmatimonadales bacterium]
MKPSARSRVFALLGDPVAHSLSPRMHNAAFTVLGLDAVYVALRCSEATLPGLMRAVVEAGGGGNVTVPYKAAAAGAVDRMVGSLPTVCNTFFGDDGVVVGNNTDVTGIVHALDLLDAPSTAWLVVGTGGSSRAVLAAARERGARLAIRSRDAFRAQGLSREAEALGIHRAAEPECEVVINTTPLGLQPNDPLPITPFEAPRARWVLDLVYGPGGTPLVRAFAECGATTADGREVLVAQGAAALACWFPGVRAPTEVMRAEVHGALG